MSARKNAAPHIASRTRTSPNPDILLERVIEALRDVWRDGPSRFDDRDRAVAAIRDLAARAGATNDAAATFTRAIATLGTLPPALERRRNIVERIATELKAVRPHFGAATPSPVEIGTLNTAHGERRAGRQTKPRSSTPRIQAPVAPLPPDASITTLPRVGPTVAEKLAKLRLQTVEDVLRYAPRRHIDYANPTPIGSPFGLRGDVTIKGTIDEIREEYGRDRGRTVARVRDDTGALRVTWFNTFVSKQLREGDVIFVSGTVRGGYNGLEIMGPDWERADSPGLLNGLLVPVYGLTAGVHQKTLRNLSRHALDATRTTLTDWLPDARPFMAEGLSASLPPLGATYESLHYPADKDAFAQARRRLTFEDLLLLQIGLIKRKGERRAAPGKAFAVDGASVHAFKVALPFQLTGAQERAVREIVRDVMKDEPMARLLQGDVGSGKTVVAATIALIARDCGRQTALMAPTELLAEQHLHSLERLYAGLPDSRRPRVALLTGSTRAKARRELKGPLEAGEIDILVGTHALIQEDVAFRDLGLVVIDEQHRFGVRQRSMLAEKSHGIVPHVLSMTATPIPRTLNFVLTGDIDVSIIDERPPGRIPIETRRYSPPERHDAYRLVREQILLGHQAFVICPLVEESDRLEARSAIDEAERLQRDVFPDLRVDLVHGRMSGKKKDEVMSAFRAHGADVLVSTSVIEVGIDVPNATVMMIEGAERFGLSQLHQFRGRVGRGGARSYCLLLSDVAGIESDARLQTMIDTDDGFLLAERDLEMRGPGDFIGTRQSGLPELDWLTGGFDTRLLDAAREVAERIVDADPDVSPARFPLLQPRLQQFWRSSQPPDLAKT